VSASCRGFAGSPTWRYQLKSALGGGDRAEITVMKMIRRADTEPAIRTA